MKNTKQHLPTDTLQDFFMDFKGKEDANHKLRWLFGHNYLTEPSVQEYIAQVTETDKFIIPCGPLALFLHEWIDLLTNGETECWEEIEGLYPAIPEISDEMKGKEPTTYQLFTKVQTVPYNNIWKDIRNCIISLPKYYNGRTTNTLCPK